MPLSDDDFFLAYVSAGSIVFCLTFLITFNWMQP